MRDAGFRVNEYFIYARGLEEARSAVEARLAEYRRVSREWHDFLGFRTYPSSQRRLLSAILNGEELVRPERKKQKHLDSYSIRN